MTGGGASTGAAWTREFSAPFRDAQLRRFGRQWIAAGLLATGVAGAFLWIAWLVYASVPGAVGAALWLGIGVATPAVVAPIVVRGLRRHLWLRRVPRVDAPWLADPVWRREASPRIGASWLGVNAPALSVWMLFSLVQVVWPALRRGQTAVVVAATVASLLPAWFIVRAVLAWAWHGRLLISPLDAPFFLGGPVQLLIGVTSDGATIEAPDVHLVCIREPGTRSIFRAAPPRLRASCRAQFDEGTVLGPTSHLRVRFELPADLPPTDFRADEATYWELVVSGVVNGKSYVERVLVPVYARPGA